MTTMYEEMLVTHQPIPVERIRYISPDCEFCRLHRAGEKIMAQSPDNLVDVYHNIKYCPLCGKVLKCKGDD